MPLSTLTSPLTRSFPYDFPDTPAGMDALVHAYHNPFAEVQERLWIWQSVRRRLCSPKLPGKVEWRK